jgi:hypothetical protein
VQDVRGNFAQIFAQPSRVSEGFQHTSLELARESQPQIFVTGGRSKDERPNRSQQIVGREGLVESGYARRQTVVGLSNVRHVQYG